MGEKKDHHPLPDSVPADADGKSRGGKDQKGDESGQGIVDGKVEGTGQARGGGEAEKVDGDGDADRGQGGPTPVHGVPQGVEKVTDHVAPGKSGGQGESGEESGKDKGEEEKNGPGGAQPGDGPGERRKGWVLGQAGSGGRKKQEGEAKQHGHAKDAVQQDGESGTGLLFGKPADEVVQANGVPAGGADQEEAEKKAHQGEVKGAQERKKNFLQAQEKPETESAKQDGDQREQKGAGEPDGVGRKEPLTELGEVDPARKETEDACGDGQADPGGKAA